MESQRKLQCQGVTICPSRDYYIDLEVLCLFQILPYPHFRENPDGIASYPVALVHPVVVAHPDWILPYS